MEQQFFQNIVFQKNIKDVKISPIEEQNPIEYGIAYQKKSKEKYIKYF